MSQQSVCLCGGAGVCLSCAGVARAKAVRVTGAKRRAAKRRASCERRAPVTVREAITVPPESGGSGGRARYARGVAGLTPCRYAVSHVLRWREGGEWRSAQCTRYESIPAVGGECESTLPQWIEQAIVCTPPESTRGSQYPGAVQAVTESQERALKRERKARRIALRALKAAGYVPGVKVRHGGVVSQARSKVKADRATRQLVANLAAQRKARAEAGTAEVDAKRVAAREGMRRLRAARRAALGLDVEAARDTERDLDEARAAERRAMDHG